MADDWKPRYSPWLIAVSVMLATFMEVLDTSVATVALPHIAGSLSASVDGATWVLTGYPISNAIVLPSTSWFSSLFGRKQYQIISVSVFAFASALCGASTSLAMLVTARVIQGAAGGGLQPVSQAVLLESFPRQTRTGNGRLWAGHHSGPADRSNARRVDYRLISKGVPPALRVPRRSVSFMLYER